MMATTRSLLVLLLLLLAMACSDSPTSPTESREVPVINSQIQPNENNAHLNVAVRLQNGEAGFLCAYHIGSYTLPDGTVAKVRYMLSRTPCAPNGTGEWYPVPITVTGR